MARTTVARNAAPVRDAGLYPRHRLKQTLLYQSIDQHYPTLTAHLTLTQPANHQPLQNDMPR